ncbi:hypothetical protein E2C01_063506 [Portunus trituberculatus]|uniref:Uncharacterized protein n=1 Tax=Portunus trituberculatus TaxID=210409 RepID=A0A5B7HJ54_PORTR|nr:hypothetical protein [Portunus trituberculatus]
MGPNLGRNVPCRRAPQPSCSSYLSVWLQPRPCRCDTFLSITTKASRNTHLRLQL